MEGPMSVFAIYADYRKKNDNMIPYYVVAPSAEAAKERFHRVMSWLMVYRIKRITDETLIQDIRANRTKYICLSWVELQNEAL